MEMNLILEKARSIRTNGGHAMGLFDKKKKVTIDDMAMNMTLAATSIIGKISCFNDVSDLHSMAVNMGYFYGFLKLQLNRITSLENVNSIIHKSITSIENSTKDKPGFEDFGYKVRSMSNNSAANLQYALNDCKENPFSGLAVYYLNDLYNTTSISDEEVRIAIAMENLMMLKRSSIKYTCQSGIIDSEHRSC